MEGNLLRGKRYFIGVGLVFVAGHIVGCKSAEPPTYPVILPAQSAYTPVQGSPNAFDGYALAALRVEGLAKQQKDGESTLTRVTFFKRQREKALALAQPGLQLLRQSASKRCDYKFIPRKPFEPLPYVKGWRLLGLALQWRIKAACENGDYDSAITDAVLATKFGFDMTGGEPASASQGYWVMGLARKAIAPYLSKMGAAQLRNLSAGAKQALMGRPDLKITLQHDHENMLATIQYVQDCYQKGDYTQLLSEWRSDAKDVVSTLKNVKPNDPKRTAYFQRLITEADHQTARLTGLVGQPQSKRPLRTAKLRRQPKGWRFNRHFLAAGENLLDMDDEAVARTRLLILEAELQRACKLTRVAPHDLTQFTKALTIDPYTGQSFVYRSVGQEYEIYSTGEDFIDNNGDTDETFTGPDLRLERSSG